MHEIYSWSYSRFVNIFYQAYISDKKRFIEPKCRNQITCYKKRSITSSHPLGLEREMVLRAWWNIIELCELRRQKEYLRTCASSEDSDQPAHSRRLIWIFADAFWIAKDAKYLSWCAGWFESSLGALVRRYIFSLCDCFLLRVWHYRRTRFLLRSVYIVCTHSASPGN